MRLGQSATTFSPWLQFSFFFPLNFPLITRVFVSFLSSRDLSKKFFDCFFFLEPFTRPYTGTSSDGLTSTQDPLVKLSKGPPPPLSIYSDHLLIYTINFLSSRHLVLYNFVWHRLKHKWYVTVFRTTCGADTEIKMSVTVTRNIVLLLQNFVLFSIFFMPMPVLFRVPRPGASSA